MMDNAGNGQGATGGSRGYTPEDFIRAAAGITGKSYLTQLREAQEAAAQTQGTGAGKSRAKEKLDPDDDDLTEGVAARPRNIDEVAEGCPFMLCSYKNA